MADDELWQLLRAVAADDAAAWPLLLAALEPLLAQFARRQPIGRLRDREDTPREVLTRVIARLHARDHAAIKKLVALDPPPQLRAWLRVLVRRSAIDFMRESPEYERANSRWVSLATLASGAPSPDPDSLVAKRAEVTAFIRTSAEQAREAVRVHGDDAISRLALDWKIGQLHVRRLVAKSEQYVVVLEAVLAGHSYPEIAERLAVTRREVELTIRYIEELLRARSFT